MTRREGTVAGIVVAAVRTSQGHHHVVVDTFARKRLSKMDDGAD